MSKGMTSRQKQTRDQAEYLTKQALHCIENGNFLAASHLAQSASVVLDDLFEDMNFEVRDTA